MFFTKNYNLFIFLFCGLDLIMKNSLFLKLNLFLVFRNKLEIKYLEQLGRPLLMPVETFCRLKMKILNLVLSLDLA
jgi:hypothetical protein